MTFTLATWSLHGVLLLLLANFIFAVAIVLFVDLYHWVGGKQFFFHGKQFFFLGDYRLCVCVHRFKKKKALKRNWAVSVLAMGGQGRISQT